MDLTSESAPGTGKRALTRARYPFGSAKMDVLSTMMRTASAAGRSEGAAFAGTNGSMEWADDDDEDDVAASDWDV